MQSWIKTLSVALISVFITYLLGEYKYSVENYNGLKNQDNFSA